MQLTVGRSLMYLFPLSFLGKNVEQFLHSSPISTFSKKAVMQSVFKKNAKKAVVELRSSSNVAAALHLIEVCNLRFILMILKEKMASL